MSDEMQSPLRKVYTLISITKEDMITSKSFTTLEKALQFSELIKQSPGFEIFQGKKIRWVKNPSKDHVWHLEIAHPCLGLKMLQPSESDELIDGEYHYWVEVSTIAIVESEILN